MRAKILFGKWTRLARETVNVDMTARGRVKIKANLVVRDLRIVIVTGSKFITDKFDLINRLEIKI